MCTRSRVQIPAEPITFLFYLLLFYLFQFLKSITSWWRSIGSAPPKGSKLSIRFEKTSAKKNHLFSCENDEVIWEKVKQSARGACLLYANGENICCQKSSKVSRLKHNRGVGRIYRRWVGHCAEYCKITKILIWDQIKIIWEKSDLRSDQIVFSNSDLIWNFQIII